MLVVLVVDVEVLVVDVEVLVLVVVPDVIPVVIVPADELVVVVVLVVEVDPVVDPVVVPTVVPTVVVVGGASPLHGRGRSAFTFLHASANAHILGVPSSPFSASHLAERTSQ